MSKDKKMSAQEFKVYDTIMSKIPEKDIELRNRVDRALHRCQQNSVKKKLYASDAKLAYIAESVILPPNHHMIWNVQDLKTAIDSIIYAGGIVGVDTETKGLDVLRDEIVAIQLYSHDGGQGYYIPLNHVECIKTNPKKRAEYEEMKRTGTPQVGVDYVECLDHNTVIGYLDKLFGSDCKFVWHNYLFDAKVIYVFSKIIPPVYFDTCVAQKLLDENQSAKLKDMVGVCLGIKADKFSALFSASTTFDKVPILIDPVSRAGCLAGYYAIKDPELTVKMYDFQIRNLDMNPKLADIRSLMFDVEIPILNILMNAWIEGIPCNKKYLEKEVAPLFHEQRDTLYKDIVGELGEINLNSPAQLSKKLYEDLKIPQLPKYGTSTNAKALHKLAKMGYSVCAKVGEYRKVEKLCSSFADALPKAITAEGKVHCGFNGIGAKTGRMSSFEPNLQQMPSKIGPVIRNAFHAKKGRVLVSIDFSL